jgi:aryl-alcohol dehydrogenase-like predicted oxidoreductase
MKYKFIKDMLISQIGYGTWPLAGSVKGMVVYGEANDEDSKKALLKSFDLGVNFFDTADVYGHGHVESLLGEVFHGKRNEIFIITKGGMIINDKNQNFSPEHLTTSLTNSLRRLKTDCVDIYMLHSPPISALENGELLKVLFEFKNSGKIKHYGISLASPKDGFDAINKYNFDIIEVNFNLLDQRCIHNGLFDLCVSKNVSTIIRTPLYQGLLTGKFVFSDSKSDLRNNWSKEKTTFLTTSYDKLLSYAKNKNLTNAQNSLKFCVSIPAVTSVIPGMKTCSEVEENTANDIFRLFSKEELDMILEEYKNTGL